ncbi:MAG: hypothetical protein LBK67_06625 [Coriobacteriales bacterium]|jgi:hypothetical protein|nr:hypothetical protein [Coriobacteriales bacterium]
MSLRISTFLHDDSTGHVGIRFAHPSLCALNFNLDVKFFGAAANAQDMANALYRLGSLNTTVESTVHMDDFVGRLIGLNDPTYGTRPEESSRPAEWWNMFFDYPTVHSCYGGLASQACLDRYGEHQTNIYNPTKE